jgi:hypothetical protein
MVDGLGRAIEENDETNPIPECGARAQAIEKETFVGKLEALRR